VTSQDGAPKSEMIIDQAEDGRTRIECRFEGTTIWLTQAHMHELFQTTLQNINLPPAEVSRALPTTSISW
jgi:hypothetical protein